MGYTVSKVLNSNPDALSTAANEAGAGATRVDENMTTQRRQLENLATDWAGTASAAAQKQGTDMLTVLCHTEDDDGNSFTDEDIVNHMIFLMMAAHDTSTSTTTTMAYNLAANPEWQERCRDESDRLGDGLLDIEALGSANVAGCAVNAFDARTWQIQLPADAQNQDPFTQPDIPS